MKFLKDEQRISLDFLHTQRPSTYTLHGMKIMLKFLATLCNAIQDLKNIKYENLAFFHSLNEYNSCKKCISVREILIQIRKEHFIR